MSLGLPEILVLLVFLIYPFLFLLGAWIFVWAAVLLRLPKALGRFAADLVQEYRRQVSG